MRTYQHVIDTMAIKDTLNAIPDHWVIRDLNERDYGIDLMLEIFTEAGNDHNGHAYYEASGWVCNLQVKGTNSSLSINSDDNTVSFSMDKKSLIYVEKFATPFLLVRVCTLENEKAIYYIWLQRYISDVLETNHPDWREGQQESFTIRLPVLNSLPTNTDKIEKIAARIKYVEEQSEFYEKYVIIRGLYNGMIEKTLDDEGYDYCIKNLSRISNLSTLLTPGLNNSQIDQSDIVELINFINEIKAGQASPKSIEEFPSNYNLELLFTDNFMRMAAEELIAESSGQTVY